MYENQRERQIMDKNLDIFCFIQKQNFLKGFLYQDLTIIRFELKDLKSKLRSKNFQEDPRRLIFKDKYTQITDSNFL